jgi:hypothetical protein
MHERIETVFLTILLNYSISKLPESVKKIDKKQIYISAHPLLQEKFSTDR